MKQMQEQAEEQVCVCVCMFVCPYISHISTMYVYDVCVHLYLCMYVCMLIHISYTFTVYMMYCVWTDLCAHVCIHGYMDVFDIEVHSRVYM